jgi:hypothetical protein
VLAACLVLAVAALGSFAVAATVLAPAAAAQAPSDGAGGSGATAELPRTATGEDGFVVLGLALAATTTVALVMALRNRGIARERGRPAGWDRATGRAAGPLASTPVTPRSRYSSRSRRR